MRKSSPGKLLRHTLLMSAFAGLAFCGMSVSAQAADKADNASANKVWTIVNVPKLTGIPWFDRMKEGVDKYAKDTGMKAYQQGSGKGDASAQVRVIKDVLASGVDALTVVPFQPAAVEQVLGKAMDDGVIVITQEAPHIKHADYDLEAFKNAAYGRHLMDALAKRMGGKGEYAMMVGSLSSTTHMEWVKAAEAYQKEKYPDMKHVGGFVETHDSVRQAYDAMQQLLSRFPDLKGVQGSASTDVVGVGQAVDQAGLNDKIAVVGTSTAKGAKTGLDNGSIDLISFWDPGHAGYAMSVVAQKLLDGEKITNGMNLGVPGFENISIEGKVIYGDNAWIDVTKKNVNDYSF